MFTIFLLLFVNFFDFQIPTADIKIFKLILEKILVETRLTSEGIKYINKNRFKNFMYWFSIDNDELYNNEEYGKIIYDRFMSLVKNSWFVGFISTKQAEIRLNYENEAGIYLIRLSPSELNPFILSYMNVKKVVKHFPIKKLNNVYSINIKTKSTQLTAKGETLEEMINDIKSKKSTLLTKGCIVGVYPAVD